MLGTRNFYTVPCVSQRLIFILCVWFVQCRSAVPHYFTNIISPSIALAAKIIIR